MLSSRSIMTMTFLNFSGLIMLASILLVLKQLTYCMIASVCIMTLRILSGLCLMILIPFGKQEQPFSLSITALGSA